MSLKSIGWYALVVCIGAVTVTTFSQGGQPSTQPNIQSSRALPRGITIVAVDGANSGGYATVAVQTTPRAECSIRYVTPHGTISRAKGLDDQVTDSDGKTSWTWKIGSHTEPGTGSVIVTCNGLSATAPIGIGQ